MDLVEEIKAIINAELRTELKNQLVELGASDELKKQAAQLTKLTEEAGKELRKYEAIKNSLKMYFKKLAGEGNTLNSNINTLTKAANELGVPVSSIDAYEIAKEALKQIGKIQIEIDNAIK